MSIQPAGNAVNIVPETSFVLRGISRAWLSAPRTPLTQFSSSEPFFPISTRKQIGSLFVTTDPFHPTPSCENPKCFSGSHTRQSVKKVRNKRCPERRFFIGLPFPGFLCRRRGDSRRWRRRIEHESRTTKRLGFVLPWQLPRVRRRRHWQLRAAARRVEPGGDSAHHQ